MNLTVAVSVPANSALAANAEIKQLQPVIIE
jgi:hypothetical protein